MRFLNEMFDNKRYLLAMVALVVIGSATVVVARMSHDDPAVLDTSSTMSSDQQAQMCQSGGGTCNWSSGVCNCIGYGSTSTSTPQSTTSTTQPTSTTASTTYPTSTPYSPYSSDQQTQMCSAGGGHCDWTTGICNCIGYSSTGSTLTTQSTTTTPTASTSCSSGYYWNGTSCIRYSPYPTSTATYTPYPTNYYYGGTTLTTEQQDSVCRAGGGTCNWTNGICNCQGYKAPTTSYSPYSTATTFANAIDNPAYRYRLPPGNDKYDCVKRALGGEFDFFNDMRNPGSTQEYSRFDGLTSKIGVCYVGSGQSTTKTVEAVLTEAATRQFSDQERSCLLQAVGEARFKEIALRSAEPTASEKAQAQACFSTSTREKVGKIEYTTADQKLAPATESCLRRAVGSARFEEINSHRSVPTNDEAEKGQQCFQKEVVTNALAPAPVLKVDDKILACVQKTVSIERYTVIKAGTTTPTTQEQEAASRCFADINAAQKAFLPTPPEQVPFLVIDTKLVEKPKADTAYDTTKDGKQKPTVLLTGKTAADTKVTLYLYSDPIVVTTQTDANGVWSYKLDQPLDAGNHIAYVAVKTAKGDEVRSEVLQFKVAQAIAAGNTDAGLIVNQPVDTTKQAETHYLWRVVSIIALGIIGMIVLVLVRTGKLRKVKRVDQSQPETPPTMPPETQP